MNAPKPDQLADVFCSELAKELKPELIKEIKRRNATPEYEGVCASHDFCDANQVMADALERLGFEYEQKYNEIINSAWQIAKNRGFETINENKIKLATMKREFLHEYKGDFTYVVVEENDENTVLRFLNFPDKPSITVPAEHVNVFDEISQPRKD